MDVEDVDAGNSHSQFKTQTQEADASSGRKSARLVRSPEGV